MVLDHRREGVSRLKTVLFMLGFIILAGTAQAATVAPHRAIYDLSLLRASEGSALQTASGRLAYEIDGSSCDGYTVNFRMATRYRPAEGAPTLIDTTTTTFESGDATELRHHSKEVVDGSMRENVRLRMSRASPSAEGSGELSSKPEEPFSIPAGAVLPMQHQFKLIALGEAGGGRDSSVLFDGSDGPTAYRAISFVGKLRPAGSIARDASNPAAVPLSGNQAWPMTVSYYPLEGESEIPEYQVSFDLYDNGVATGLVLDYGDFALKGTLTDLTLLEPGTCP